MDFIFDSLSVLSPSKIKLLSIFIAVVVAMVLFSAYQKHKQKKYLSSIQYQDINSGLTGLVKLKGQAQTTEQGETYSPLSNTPAVWYYYSIEEYHDDDQVDDSYYTIKEQQSQSVFVLKNIRQACLVDASNIKTLEVQKRIWYEDNETPKNIPLLGSTEENPKRTQYRFTEIIIEPNETLHLLGEAHEVPKELQNLKTGLENKANCFIKAPSKKPLYLSNTEI